MGKSLEDWSYEKISKLRTLAVLVAGIITMLMGYGAWRSPRLDWISFRNTFRQFMIVIFEEMSRMINDPFAFVGLVVMIVGTVLTINSVKQLIADWTQ